MSNEWLRVTVAYLRDEACDKTGVTLTMTHEHARLLANIVEATLPKTKRVKVYRFTAACKGTPCIYSDTVRVQLNNLRNAFLREEEHYTCISEITEHEQDVPA